MDDRLVVYGPGPERSWSTIAFPYSVNAGTGNTSVARGRVFHQHNVWHCLTQMLWRDVALTFLTLVFVCVGGNTVMLVCIMEGSFAINKISFRERHTVCYPEQQRLTCGRNDGTKQLLKMKNFIFLLFVIMQVNAVKDFPPHNAGAAFQRQMLPFYPDSNLTVITHITIS